MRIVDITKTLFLQINFSTFFLRIRHIFPLVYSSKELIFADVPSRKIDKGKSRVNRFD